MLRIKEICSMKGITLQELAKRMGVTYQSLYESMTKNPSLNKLRQIAEALGVELYELFKPDDFLAVIRKGGETYTFEREEDLKEWLCPGSIPLIRADKVEEFMREGKTEDAKPHKNIRGKEYFASETEGE